MTSGRLQCQAIAEDQAMSSDSVCAVLFAKNQRVVAEFYRRVLGAAVTAQDQHHTSLQVQGLNLVIHQMPEEIARDVTISVPPQRREDAVLRLDFTVSDITGSRALAHQFGGAIADHPPPWAGTKSSFFLGSDPEGNVFGLNASGVE
jgi:predicted enzyme related to lactoylglutathione lyase